MENKVEEKENVQNANTESAEHSETKKPGSKKRKGIIGSVIVVFFVICIIWGSGEDYYDFVETNNDVATGANFSIDFEDFKNIAKKVNPFLGTWSSTSSDVDGTDLYACTNDTGNIMVSAYVDGESNKLVGIVYAIASQGTGSMSNAINGSMKILDIPISDEISTNDLRGLYDETGITINYDKGILYNSTSQDDGYGEVVRLFLMAGSEEYANSLE